MLLIVCLICLPTDRVRIGESDEWMASRREDVEQHAAQTLEYDWCGR